MSEIVKFVRNCQICQSCQKLSKLSEIVKIVRNCQCCQNCLFWEMHFFSLGKSFFLSGNPFFSQEIIFSQEINFSSGHCPVMSPHKMSQRSQVSRKSRSPPGPDFYLDFGLRTLDFVLRPLQALRQCDPHDGDWIVCLPVDSVLAAG